MPRTKTTKDKASATVRLARVRIEDALYDVDDAEQTVVCPRTLADVVGAKRGDAQRCMDARCVTRRHDLFPHPVLGVSVTKTKVYVIDRPGHCVRYTLTSEETAQIARHDTKGVGEPGTLVCQAPTGKARKGSSHDTGKTPRPEGNYDGSRTSKLGEAGRVLARVGSALPDLDGKEQA